MENILLKYMTERMNEEKSSKREPGPVITLSREYGCYASRIAEILSQRLSQLSQKDKKAVKWQVVSNEILEEAAKKLEAEGISVEVINLRTLRPMDTSSIIKSVKKTNRLVTVEEGWPTCGIGAEIISLISESSAFDYLDSPPVRVTGVDVPMPYAVNLEHAALPHEENIIKAVKKTLFRNK